MKTMRYSPAGVDPLAGHKLKKIMIMENQVIVVTPEQLQMMIDKSVNALFSKLEKQKGNNNNDVMNIEEVLLFLKYKKVKISKSYIYTLVSKKSIPYRKVGKSLRFSKKEILRWIKEREVSPDQIRSESANELAKSANRKGRK